MKTKFLAIIMCLSFLLDGCVSYRYTYSPYQVKDLPAYSGEPYAELNGNIPHFGDEDYTDRSFEAYSELDYLGRCGFALAAVGRDIMPERERGAIGAVKPTGWHTVKYDCVDGKYLYNRCHLLGYQLTGENANERNLITGTRYMNTEGMLPFENMVAEYVRATDNHVLLRVTPVFEGENLLANGVVMEALSMEDGGAGICFNVYCYNVQPGIEIDYKTGDSRENEQSGGAKAEVPQTEYILNTNTKKIHTPECESTDDIGEENKQRYLGRLTELTEKGYKVCKRCNPK